jgi:hypothetical protein
LWASSSWCWRCGGGRPNARRPDLGILWVADVPG